MATGQGRAGLRGLAFCRIEELVTRDVAGRGLLSGPIGEAVRAAGAGALRRSALCLLAASDGPVAIYSGFRVPREGGGLAPETDGPLGAAMLAETLSEDLGIATLLVLDPATAEVSEGLAPAVPRVVVSARPSASARRQLARAVVSVAIERLGPSHDLDTLRAQRRLGPAPEARFLELVPREARGRCFSMRGLDLSAELAPLHAFYEAADDRPRLAIGDGGNELGMGALPWEWIADALGAEGARIACRVGCDELLTVGVSNWGAYALSAALLLESGRPGSIAERLDPGRERARLAAMIGAGAVCGVSGVPALRVDGLDWSVHREVLLGLGRVCRG